MITTAAVSMPGRRAGYRRSGDQILWILRLVPDVKRVNGIVPDREENLVGIEKALAYGFSEVTVFICHPALLPGSASVVRSNHVGLP
jgi:hypothetical protein